MSVDWKKIGEEYIGSNITQKELAIKYGVSIRSIVKHSKKGDWFTKKREERMCFDDEKVSIGDSDISCVNPAKINLLAEELYKKTKTAIECLDDEALDTGRLRQLVQSVKDLKEIAKNTDDDKDVSQLEKLVNGFLNV